MGLLADHQIRKLVKIKPFAEESFRPGVISYGLSSYGYDVRVGSKFKIFTGNYSCNGNVTYPDPVAATFRVVDPKNFTSDLYVNHSGPDCIIPANSFVLAETVEYFEIPRNVLAVCVGKSTYARCGIIVNITPLEPEWRGKITIEISNTTPVQAKIYANEGIAQILFFKADEVCEKSYADKKGKYQDQKGLTLPIVN